MEHMSRGAERRRIKNKLRTKNGSYLHGFVGRTLGLIDVKAIHYQCIEPRGKARLADVTQKEAFGCT